jgi:hypothetical protein
MNNFFPTSLGSDRDSANGFVSRSQQSEMKVGEKKMAQQM